MRDIEDILNFRQDISPFLAHLTRQRTVSPRRTAAENLRKIIDELRIRPGKGAISDARWGFPYSQITPAIIERYFSAISFTETPIGELHCLLEIDRRQVNLEPYGLVFLKETLSSRGVSPVIYLNNEQGSQDSVVRALCSLIDSKPQSAARLLPLVAFYGQALRPVGGTAQGGRMDFRWEREWRYPAALGPLEFEPDDVFIGLCPHDEIEEFEDLLPGVGFIDPTRNMKWYSTTLVAARQRHDLKVSVV